ncbi:hypothetical protein, partial [uncultured Novosphingobium sp.]|uniref:hypothetical protein n=1 Tax=uncultured Novosphingobium sp. TaxID=292277 RepID=UPI0025972B92
PAHAELVEAWGLSAPLRGLRQAQAERVWSVLGGERTYSLPEELEKFAVDEYLARKAAFRNSDLRKALVCSSFIERTEEEAIIFYH